MSQPHEIVQRLYEAFGRGDLNAMLADLSPNMEVAYPQGRNIPWGGSFHGHQGFANFLAALTSHADIEEFEVRQMLAGGNTVVALGREHVVVKATGSDFDTDWVHVWRLDGEKVTHFQVFTDSAAILDALRS